MLVNNITLQLIIKVYFVIADTSQLNSERTHTHTEIMEFRRDKNTVGQMYALVFEDVRQVQRRERHTHTHTHTNTFTDLASVRL